MALKIVRAEEPLTVKQIVVVVYGPPGLGKSTIGFTAEKPILLDFDKGAYRAAFRGDSVQVDTWNDVRGISADDLTPYNTVVVDTAGRALDVLTSDIIAKDAKAGSGGVLSLKGFGKLKGEFIAWLKALRVMNKDVVLLAHSQEDKKGDEIIERLDVQGGSKSEIYKVADAMGRLYIQDGKRVLNFNPTDVAFGKNPANLGQLTVPHVSENRGFLGDVIKKIKDSLNAMTAEQAKRQAEITDWIASFDGAKSADDFNALVESVKDVDKIIAPVVKGELMKRAIEAGLSFDKNQKCFVAAAA